MLKARLVLLKELLASTGSIYVHLDWHAVHYVKVLMDQLFGYECFQNEIIFKRRHAHSDAATVGTVHDTLLFYSASKKAVFNPQYAPYSREYVDTYYRYKDPDGRKWLSRSTTAPGDRGPVYEWNGVVRAWRYTRENMEKLHQAGRLFYTEKGMARYKQYLDEMPGMPLTSIWSDIQFVDSWSSETSGYPTQKPLKLVQRIISASSPPGGLVLDCFLGSGTTSEAAERLGRRWIGVDNGKYAIHLARKRLIQLHGQVKPPELPQYDYVECDKCKSIERKERPQKTGELFKVRAFTLENMGVYQRAEQWQDFQTQRSLYRDEMIRVFGGEPVNHSHLLHGRKGSSWVHVGPLDGPVSEAQVWSIAREAQRTDRKIVTILSADFDTLSASEKDEIKKTAGVTVVIRIIPASAIDEVRRRLEILHANPDTPVESMAIPAFYSPLSIVLAHQVKGRIASITLDRCEIDIESFLASQRPLLKPITSATTPTASAVTSE